MSCHSENINTLSKDKHITLRINLCLQAYLHTQQGYKEVHTLRRDEDVLTKGILRVGGDEYIFHNQDVHVHSKDIHFSVHITLNEVCGCT